LSPAARRRFGKITQVNLHKLMAIVLDEKGITAPVIQVNRTGFSGGSIS